MPRTPRTQYLQPNSYYHVISRTINQAQILKDPGDFQRFKQLMREAKHQFPLRLFHYALMGTHFHFVVQLIQPEDLAENLRYLKWHYTQWARKQYGWKGPLWRERYRSLPIQDETYLAACGLYVEFNPVRAGLCQEPFDYPHSSARTSFLGQPDDLLDTYTPAPVPEPWASAAKNPLAADLVFTDVGNHP